MKTVLFRLSAGFQCLEIAGAVVFLMAISANAQRAERLQRAQNRAERDTVEVREWARQRGIKIRHDDGVSVKEIRAIRNGRPVYFSTYNDNAAISTGASAIRKTLPFDVDGSGVIVGIWDGGLVKSNHQEFGDRVTALDSAYVNYHATHVGGTIGASGIVARAEGMAPAARIYSSDWNSDEYEMISLAASLPGESDRIYLSNHSYGIIAGWFYAYWMNPWTRKTGYHWWGDISTGSADLYFGQYSPDVSYLDEIVYDAPYFLPFKAVGNERDDNPPGGATVYYTPDNGITWTNAVYDPSIHPQGDGIYKNGYDCIPYRGNAKNILTVGAVYDAVSNGVRNVGGAGNMGFSSWGPTDDGRIKPDIVANGFELYSCDSRNATAYASRSGTSMSCPNACGSAALLVDYFDTLIPGGAMRASTLKGLIIHTADDLGRPGPDYQTGWGLMNTWSAADLLKDFAAGNLIRLTEAALSGSNTVETYTGFTDGREPVRATLCWTDPPGPGSWDHDRRTPVLVNDLDLKIIGPDGTNYPFTLRFENPEANAETNKKNHVDNVEQVIIQTPVTGEYTIMVGYEGSLQEQHYSLLISGLSADLDENELPDDWEAQYLPGITNALASADPDGDGYDNLSEYISGSDPLNPDSVFGFTSTESVQAFGHQTFVVKWNSLPRRVYNVFGSYNLLYVPFENISGDLHWPAGSYTDRVDQAGDVSLYRIDVRMEE